MIDLNTIDSLTVDELAEHERRLERALATVRGSRQGLEALERANAARVEDEAIARELVVEASTNGVERLLAALAGAGEASRRIVERTVRFDSYARGEIAAAADDLEAEQDRLPTALYQANGIARKLGLEGEHIVASLAREIIGEAELTDRSVDDSFVCDAVELRHDVARQAREAGVGAALQARNAAAVEDARKAPERDPLDIGRATDAPLAEEADRVDEPSAPAESSPAPAPTAEPPLPPGLSVSEARILAVYQRDPSSWIGSGKAGERCDPPVKDPQKCAASCRRLLELGYVVHSGKGGSASRYMLAPDGRDRVLTADHGLTPDDAAEGTTSISRTVDDDDVERVLEPDEAAARIREQDGAADPPAAAAPSPSPPAPRPRPRPSPPSEPAALRGELPGDDIDDEPPRRLNLRPKVEPPRPAGPPVALSLAAQRAAPDPPAQGKPEATMSGRILTTLSYRESTFPELCSRLQVVEAEDRRQALVEVDKLIQEGEVGRKRDHPGQAWTYYAQHPELA